jgi:predicted ferric reductase
MTGMEKSRQIWKGETVHVNRDMLDRYLHVVASPAHNRVPISYIAGPPQMVNGLQTMLTAASVDTDDIRTEEFSGY